MTENGLLLQKKSDRLFSGTAMGIILVISLTLTSACVQSSEPGDYYPQGIYYNNHNNQYDKALEYFNKSVGAEPGNPRVWFARSVTLYNLKRYDESLESLNTTIAIDPGYEGAGVMREEILSAMAKTGGTGPGDVSPEILINTTPSAGRGSVSNLYIVPAGTFTLFHETNVPTDQTVTCNSSGLIDETQNNSTICTKLNDSFRIRLKENSRTGNPSEPVPGERVIASFGLDANNPDRTIFINNPNLAERFINASEADISVYYYPKGPVIGYRKDMQGAIIVMIDDSEKVNLTVASEIHDRISARGRTFGIMNVPCKFVLAGIVEVSVPRDTIS
jgi:tetratricopeptide (TPR) repeat protein